MNAVTKYIHEIGKLKRQQKSILAALENALAASELHGAVAHDAMVQIIKDVIRSIKESE